jgi:hypothetical protein
MGVGCKAKLRVVVFHRRIPECVSMGYEDPTMYCMGTCVSSDVMACVDAMRRRVLPVWGVPVVVLLSTFLAWAVTVLFEDPLRRALRSRASTSGPFVGA